MSTNHQWLMINTFWLSNEILKMAPFNMKDLILHTFLFIVATIASCRCKNYAFTSQDDSALRMHWRKTGLLSIWKLMNTQVMVKIAHGHEKHKRYLDSRIKGDTKSNIEKFHIMQKKLVSEGKWFSTGNCWWIYELISSGWSPTFHKHLLCLCACKSW